LSQPTASVADLVKDALKRRQVGHDEMARSLLDIGKGYRIALRRRNKRLTDVIDPGQISVAREECQGADRLFRLPTIRITTFPA
jgi:beta-lactamase superfamily II metal-dependent hydrolase